MPAQFHVGLPTDEQRSKILRLVLSTETVDEDVDLNRLSKLTTGFSGSDLRELCRNASVYRIREYMKRNGNTTSNSIRNSQASSSNDAVANNLAENPPPICMQDLLSSFGKMKESKMHTGMLTIDSRIDLD